MQADLAPLLGNEYDVYQPKSYKNMAACIHFLVKFLKKPNFLIGTIWEPKILAKRLQTAALLLNFKIQV